MLSQALYEGEGTREKAIRKRIVKQKAGHREDVRIVRMFNPKTLDRPEVVGIPEFVPALLEEAPIPLLPLTAECFLEIASQVERNPVGIEQRIIDINEKHHLVIH